MTLAQFILAFACVINLSLGLFIFLRNPKSYSGITFFLITTNTSMWAVSNYFTEAQHVSLTVNSFFNSLAYLFGLLAIASISLFCLNFPEKYSVTKKKRTIFFSVLAVWAVLSVTPLVAGHVTRSNGELHFSVGPLSAPYALGLLILFGVGVKKLITTKKNSDPKVRHQINLVLTGFIMSVVLTLSTNLIIPSFAGSFETAKFGPLLTVFLVATTAYAIVKYGLFDIRLVVARSVAYLLAVLTLAAIYTSVVFAFTLLVLHGSIDGLNAGQQLISVLTALFLAFTFQPLRKFFNRTTNSLFYRDAYEPQILLDELNRILVSSIELEILLQRSSQTIQKYLKSDFCLIGLKATKTEKQRIIGTSKKTFSQEDIEFTRHITPHINHKVIATDALDETELKRRLQKNNIDVLVRLVDKTAIHEEGVGYLLLGRKKSGSPYTSQDKRVLEIVANSLVIAIQNALRFEEIQHFNITLQDEVKKATYQLRQANERLRLLDRTKDDFISMASHQLRTPLTSVKGYLSMTLEGDGGKVNDKQRKLLSQAFISSQRMVYLIADMLNVSRLKTGKFIIEPELTDLADAVGTELDQVMGTAEARGLKLTYHKPSNFPSLMIDQTKIRQVIMNFVDNAIYYTPSGGRIDVSLKDTGTTIDFTVTDNGIGVPKAEQHHLFNKFYRANNAKKARPDGTGLGLFMAKKVIIAQGGSIVFHSQEGKGSTFGFTIAKNKLQPNTQSKLGKSEPTQVAQPQKQIKNA